MGESGSGKSTLLHVLGGLDTPKTGTVRFQGKSIYGMTSIRRARFRAENVGLVFQSFHLLPELDIVENVALPAMAKRGRVDARSRAIELLGEVGLADRIGHRPQELSGGEQQRVAIARSTGRGSRIAPGVRPVRSCASGKKGWLRSSTRMRPRKKVD